MLELLNVVQIKFIKKIFKTYAPIEEKQLKPKNLNIVLFSCYHAENFKIRKLINMITRPLQLSQLLCASN